MAATITRSRKRCCTSDCGQAGNEIWYAGGLTSMIGASDERPLPVMSGATGRSRQHRRRADDARLHRSARSPCCKQQIKFGQPVGRRAAWRGGEAAAVRRGGGSSTGAAWSGAAAASPGAGWGRRRQAAWRGWGRRGGSSRVCECGGQTAMIMTGHSSRRTLPSRAFVGSSINTSQRHGQALV